MNHRHIFFVAAAMAFGGTALAQTAAPVTAAVVVKTGQIIRDANALRLGSIERIDADGSVHVIVGDRFVVIPGSTITVADGKTMTSLTKKQVSKL